MRRFISRALTITAVFASTLTSVDAGPASGPVFGTTPTAPTCLSGFQTEIANSWLLVCRIIVAPKLKRATISRIRRADCAVNSYWNYGPKLKILQDTPNFVEMQYTCGHVEG